MNNSEKLNQFYQEYSDWLDAGAPEQNPVVFRRRGGLCTNLYDWAEHCGCSEEEIDVLCVDLHSQFAEYGLNTLLPFNPDIKDYIYESGNALCHLNEKRTKWVRDQVSLAMLNMLWDNRDLGTDEEFVKVSGNTLP